MNKRIEYITTFIPKEAIVADIGTDHAQLPILLCTQKKCHKVYACDVKDGPLDIAKENIKEAGFEKEIEVIASDGFEHVPYDIDVAVIAGMGYYTAIHILENAFDRLGELKRIIIQINSNVPLMRKWIMEHSFEIVEEGVFFEKGKYYVILCIKKGEGLTLTYEEQLCGPLLMKHPTDTYYAMVEEKIQKLETIKKTPISSKRYPKVSRELEIWKKQRKKHE